MSDDWSDLFEVDFYASRKTPRIKEWLDSLSRDRLEEYRQIEIETHKAPFGGDYHLISICKDWIEEHGGERDWWMAIYVLNYDD